jgi:hypothetical protein
MIGAQRLEGDQRHGDAPAKDVLTARCGRTDSRHGVQTLCIAPSQDFLIRSERFACLLRRQHVTSPRSENSVGRVKAAEIARKQSAQRPIDFLAGFVLLSTLGREGPQQVVESKARPSGWLEQAELYQPTQAARGLGLFDGRQCGGVRCAEIGSGMNPEQPERPGQFMGKLRIGPGENHTKLRRWVTVKGRKPIQRGTSIRQLADDLRSAVSERAEPSSRQPLQSNPQCQREAATLACDVGSQQQIGLR